MKTTIDIPAPLLRRAKAHAATHGSSLKTFVIDAIQSGLNQASGPPKTSRAKKESALFMANRLGFPVFNNRDGVLVTNELINRIREGEWV
jgi:hypothetical protein